MTIGDATRTPAANTDVLFAIEDLHASVDGTPILKGVDCVVRDGELHALMGPNGAGKSTLANVLMGNPAYEVTRGRVLFRDEDVTRWTPDERARAGIFLGFQHPESIPGVKVLNFMQTAMSRRSGVDLSLLEIRLAMAETMKSLKMDPAFMDRHLNEGFSGGERKRNEILQLSLLDPEFVVLDETDSGLDVDALHVVTDGIAAVRAKRPGLGGLVITHYQRILRQLHPDVVHVLVDGRIVATGGDELSERIDEEGFDAWRAAGVSGTKEST